MKARAALTSFLSLNPGSLVCGWGHMLRLVTKRKKLNLFSLEYILSLLDVLQNSLLMKACTNEYYYFSYQLSLAVITDRLETQWWQGLESINCWGLETWYIGQRCHRVSDDNTFFSDPMISNCCPDNVLVRGFKIMAGKDTFSELYGWPKRHTYWSTFLLNVRNKRVWWCRSDYCFIFISRVVPLTKTPGDLTLKSCFLNLSSGFLSILPSLPDTDPTGQ